MKKKKTVDWPKIIIYGAIFLALLYVIFFSFFIQPFLDGPGMTGGGTIGYACSPVTNVVIQARPTYDVIYDQNTGEECRFEKTNSGLFNVSIGDGPTDWLYEIGTVSSNCKIPIERNAIKIVTKDTQVYYCGRMVGV